MFKSKPKIVFNCQLKLSSVIAHCCSAICSTVLFILFVSFRAACPGISLSHTQTRLHIPLSLYVRLHLLYHYFARVPSFHAAISSHSPSFSLSFCHFSFSPYIRSENTPLIKTLVYLVRLSATETCLFLVGEAHSWLLL